MAIINTYERPDVYVEKQSTASAVEQIDFSKVLSIPVFVGAFSRGALNTVIPVNNWSEVQDKIAYGMISPFMPNSYAPQSVYGFYSNYNGKAYLIRIAGVGAKCAEAILGSTTPTTFVATDEGEWANDTLGVTVSVNEDSTFKLVVSFNNDIETYDNLSNDVANTRYFASVINNAKSNYLKVKTAGTLEAGTIKFTGGTSDLGTITEATYSTALHKMDGVVDFGMVVVPGATTTNIYNSVVKYCDDRGKITAILDAPYNADINTLVTTRQAINGKNAEMYHPWIKVYDPSSITNQIIDVPPSGHVSGAIARNDYKRGVYKAPAGVEVVVNNAIGLVGETISPENLGKLNTSNINCIVSKVNRGIVVWGARCVDGDYVSSKRLDADIEIQTYNALDWTIFENPSLKLCEKVSEYLKDFLKENYFSNDAFKGDTEDEAYFVICDKTNNSDENFDKGMIIADIGYAKYKPNEFTVLRISPKAGTETSTT